MSMHAKRHGGHDMSSMTMSGGIFTPEDETFGRGLWYGIAGCVGLLTIVKLANTIQTRSRLKLQRRDPQSIPSRPRGWISQAFATATATAREMSYPQPVYFTGRISRYFSPLPLGKWLTLAFYWIVILSFLWTGTILKKGDAMYAYKWEKVGFRAAWVTVTQIPFVYLLSCKFNPISILTGISYERFNWLHRWAARTMWLTAIVHWSFFYTEWSLAKIVTMQLDMMPMVKYGFGAWGVVTWMLLSGFGFFRDLCYELFVLQHIAAAGTLLWLLYVHVPHYASYNIWMAVAFVAFDWGVRIIWGLTRNMHLLGRSSTKSPGYETSLQALSGDVVRLRIDNPDFTWQAGQHVYLYMPGLRPLEFHPFTIASTTASRGLDLLIQARSGFSRTLYKSADRRAGSNPRHRAFISGPWGTPPDISHCETAVLIACSTGATFIVPILQDLMQRETCLRKIHLHWIIRSQEHCNWFEQELQAVLEHAKVSSRTRLQIHIHVTKSTAGPQTVEVLPTNTPVTTKQSIDVAITPAPGHSEDVKRHSHSLSASSTSTYNSSSPFQTIPLDTTTSDSSRLTLLSGRPDVAALIRDPVENALGETAVVVCGGLSITAETRTFVARLSDERAVHKGTGAQGIALWTETYGW
ncbi:Ferric/cupric reductase transmembrane component 1 [Cercospora beticola]|uniref:ferric-chelate reductase (NADPH) n=1 Tax=Cercospora beticola TaxID=122368 RepID=A0A2G5I352_CERBT|nr:Ferric/cupric reductase transmembrane component 1 [Cercospora beticola]PIA99234.1 Ferric/cupric reductase transmembrane component 1 [Cercospora beticola]WPB00539.1 hypothetical protein RHO25_005159 [Cercospora beticola]CAK1361243.1 unnamed protein product [Cercospora beticola]